MPEWVPINLVRRRGEERVKEGNKKRMKMGVAYLGRASPVHTVHAEPNDQLGRKE